MVIWCPRKTAVTARRNTTLKTNNKKKRNRKNVHEIRTRRAVWGTFSRSTERRFSGRSPTKKSRHWQTVKVAVIERQRRPSPRVKQFPIQEFKTRFFFAGQSRPKSSRTAKAGKPGKTHTRPKKNSVTCSTHPRRPATGSRWPRWLSARPSLELQLLLDNWIHHRTEKKRQKKKFRETISISFTKRRGKRRRRRRRRRRRQQRYHGRYFRSFLPARIVGWSRATVVTSLFPFSFVFAFIFAFFPPICAPRRSRREHERQSREKEKKNDWEPLETDENEGENKSGRANDPPAKESEAARPRPFFFRVFLFGFLDPFFPLFPTTFPFRRRVYPIATSWKCRKNIHNHSKSVQTNKNEWPLQYNLVKPSKTQ